MQSSATATANASSRIISIGGGKGGVGKSILAGNLAAAIAQTGRRVVLVDLDLGAANQHLLLGLSSARPGIQALIDGNVADLREFLTPTRIPNLELLAGTGAILGAANITFSQKRRLIRRLRSLDAVVVVDVGAGVGYNALDFFLLGGQKLLVTTPQITAVHDAYSFLKGAILRLLAQHVDREIELAILEPALMSGESVRVTELFARLRDQRPALAEKTTALRLSFGAHIIGNQVVRPTDGEIFPSLTRMFWEFLGIDVNVLGWVPSDAAVADSVNNRRPFVLGPPSEPSRVVRRMAEFLVAADVTEEPDLDLDIEIVEDEPAASAAPPAPPEIPVGRTVIPLGSLAAGMKPPKPPVLRRTLPGMTAPRHRS